MTTQTSSQQRPIPSTDLTLLDTSDGIPYEALSALRKSAPVVELPTGRLLVSRHDDVVQALRDIEVFVGGMRDAGIQVPEEDVLLIEMREPRHGRVRRLFNAALSPSRTITFEEWIRSLHNDALDQIFAAAGNIDLAALYVRTIPTAVIARLVGAPVSDHQQIAMWVDQLSQSDWLSRNIGPSGEGLAGFPDFHQYLQSLIDASSSMNPNEFLPRLLNAEIEGTTLSNKEVLTILALMLQAGSDTTRHLISNILFKLAIDSELLDVLRADRQKIPQFVEEMLRLFPPVAALLRDVPNPTSVGGCPFASGSKAALSLASSNRDPDVFGDPEAFQLGRPNLFSHVTFGSGPHICPGAALARLEARIATEVLVERVDRIELGPTWSYIQVPVFWANGPMDIVGRMTKRDGTQIS